MEVQGKEYSKIIHKLSHTIFVTAISKGANDYSQTLHDNIEATVDVLDVVFPNHNNYSALHLATKAWETTGITLKIDRNALTTQELFEFNGYQPPN